MEDDPFQNAALVLCRTDRRHRSMLPHSHRHMRLLYLGLVSDGLQAIPFDTGIGIVSVFVAVTADVGSELHVSVPCYGEGPTIFSS
jgi:hypothetical protein